MDSDVLQHPGDGDHQQAFGGDKGGSLFMCHALVDKVVVDVVAVRGKRAATPQCPQGKSTEGVQQGEGKNRNYNDRRIGYKGLGISRLVGIQKGNGLIGQ